MRITWRKAPNISRAVEQCSFGDHYGTKLIIYEVYDISNDPEYAVCIKDESERIYLFIGEGFKSIKKAEEFANKNNNKIQKIYQKWLEIINVTEKLYDK